MRFDFDWRDGRSAAGNGIITHLFHHSGDTAGDAAVANATLGV